MPPGDWKASRGHFVSLGKYKHIGSASADEQCGLLTKHCNRQDF